MSKSCRGALPLLLAACVGVVSGCLSVDLTTAADKAVGTKITKEYYQNVYTGKWCCEDPQAVLDLQLQPTRESPIDERGLQCVAVTQTWGQVFYAIVHFGFKTPVYVTWSLEK